MADGGPPAILSRAAVIVLMMEAVRTSEMSVNFDVTTRRYIPEDSELHTRRKSHNHFPNFIFL
jgi:hypothetical protein